MTARKLSEGGAKLIEGFEGFVAHPYQDSVGVWTIGYGSTKGVGPGTPNVTEGAADARLKAEVDASYGATINALGLPLNQHQFDALVSFVYNVGTGGVGVDTGVGRSLRGHQWHAAADHMLEWDKAGGQVLEGLHARRMTERALFLEPVRFEYATKVERELLRKYDALANQKRVRGHESLRSKEQRLALRKQIARHRDAVGHAARNQPHGWDLAHRRERYRMLAQRTRS